MMGYRVVLFIGSKLSDSSEGILIFCYLFWIIVRSFFFFMKEILKVLIFIGMFEEEKIDILKKYRKGVINLLVVIFVGSEGIDVLDSNFIIIYNYIGNEVDIM